MQVNSIRNYNVSTPNKVNLENKQAKMSDVTFEGEKKKDNKALRAARDLAIASMFLVPVATTPLLTSCDDHDSFAYAKAEAWGGEGYIDTLGCNHPADTIIKWWYAWDRPMPLDTLNNNFDNWKIPGVDPAWKDSLSRRNIIHYEGTREWEYGSKEIGDINVLESSKKILVYDTEIQDYKGNHESYGKRVLRIPTGNFTITTKDGITMHSPKGLFVEEYENEFGEKNGSILDCKLKTRAFVTTTGDTLNVAKRRGSSDFLETGKVAKGYLGANSILLRNLIGQYSTDDHYVDFTVEAVEDKRLRAMYVEAMDQKVD
jgi:hypothetical protein